MTDGGPTTTANASEGSTDGRVLVPTRPVTYVFANDPAVDGGGSRVRAERLVQGLSASGAPARLAVVAMPSRLARRSRQVRACLRGVPPTFGRMAPGDLREVLDECKSRGELVVAGTLWCSVAMTAAQRAESVLDAHNVEATVMDQLRKEAGIGRLRRALYGLSIRWMARFERSVARQHRAVWAVSAADGRWFAEAGAARTAVVPNGCDLPPAPASPSQGRYLLFVGSLDAEFNRAGVRWFTESCLPIVRSSVPDAELVVVGRGDGIGGPGVSVAGYVERLDTVYEGARAAIVPLLAGGGTRLKVPEALAWGVPCISTRLGAAGHDLAEGDGVLLADTPEAFAAACVRLLEDGEVADRLGAAGRATAVERLSWASSAERALRSLSTLGAEDG